MIKLKKLYLENFKGIKESKTIDFSESQINILSGPNGFGKTTIFDAIELALTSNINSAHFFSSTQHKRANRNKLIYQNNVEKDVVIKLLLEDTVEESNFIIFKHYDTVNGDKRKNESKDFIASDCAGLFDTYYSTNADNFEVNDLSLFQEIKQENINQLLYDDDLSKIENVYPLFNYLQQEDNLYFLRKSESEKHNSLSFLFNIEKEQDENNKLAELNSSLYSKLDNLNSKIDNYTESINEIEIIPTYKNIFPEKDFGFDKEKPFENNGDNKLKLDSFLENLNLLKQFKANFDFSEYEKSLTYDTLNNEIASNLNLLEAFSLSKIYSKDVIQEINNTNNYIQSLENFSVQENKTAIPKAIFDAFQYEGENYSTSFDIYNARMLAIQNELGTLGNVISDLIVARNNSVEEFDRLIELNYGGLQEENCPLCNTPFDSYKVLIESIESKTKVLQQFNLEKITERENIISQRKKILDVIESRVKKYLEINKKVDEDVLSKLRDVENFTQINYLKDIFSKYPLEDPDSLFFGKIPNSLKEIQGLGNLIKLYLVEIVLPNYQYDSNRILNKNLFVDYFDSDKNKLENFNVLEIDNKIKFIQGQYNIYINNHLNFLKGRREKIKTIIGITSPLLSKTTLCIKLYKKEMITKIKIPFYIYSGKILQSYQQGLGIFVDINQTTNNVNFITGSNSNHNIVYHLSSGQLAVVSIAFCLSLNTIYNTNEHFKFLAIDDPIQTMDDLNIHTFIELMRHEFSDYQIIMSTHDDFTSKYMKYKFDKFDLKTDIVNVQEKFFYNN